MSTPAVRVLGRLERVRGWQEDLYRDLHAHPELSHQETRTAATVADRLRGRGCEVHEGVGGTGVVARLRNGDGPVVLLRADMDALPVREETGLPYASAVTATDADGVEVSVMHACGHDVHVTCLLGAVDLLAGATEEWGGTVVAVFQPAEEVGDGARRMVEDGLAQLVGPVDLALAQHVLAFPAGQVATRPGPTLAGADSMRITVHGRGAHGSMPQASVDPVVLAAMIVVRLQTVISREIRPGDPAVLTVGSVQAGTRSNVIPDTATILLNIRTYDERTRAAILESIQRIVTAFAEHFGGRAQELRLQTASEDFSDIPTALGVPSTYWGIGGADADLYERAAAAGRVSEDVPVNHSARFAPVLRPTLDTGTTALVVAVLAWLGRTASG